MLRVESVEGLLGVRALFACLVFLLVVCAGSAAVLGVLSQFLGTSACIILPPHTRADAIFLTSVVGECACFMRCVHGSTFDRANTPLCYRGTP